MFTLLSHFSRFITVALGSALIFFIPIGVAQEERSKPVQMAYLEFPPYSFTDRDGQPKGLAVDLARRLVGATGRDLEFVVAENPGVMIDMVASGQVDMTSLLAITPDRLSIASATQPVSSFRTSLFVKKGAKARSLSDFQGLRVGALARSATIKSAHKIPDAKVTEYPTSDARILGLLNDEIDAIISPLDGFSAHLRKMGMDVLIEPVEPPLADTPMGFYVAETEVVLLRALDGEIASNLTQHEMGALYEIWFGKPTRLREHEVIFWGKIVSSIFLIVAIGALIGWQNHRLHARASLKETEELRLLIDALNGMDAAIIIFDKNLQAIHWNEGFTKSLPGMVDVLKAGVSLNHMIAISYSNGTISTDMNALDAKVFADGIVKRLIAGETLNRIVHTSDGRVMDATDFPVGCGHYASVRVDVTKLHKQAETILAQKSELAAVNDQLNMFATIAAHDLKAPLLQQTNLLEFIKEDISEGEQDLPEDVYRYFGMLTDSSVKMRRLINDLLEHAQASKSKIMREVIDPNERLPDIFTMAGFPANFTAEIEPNMPNVFVDPISFDTVLRNLIANAVKHHDRDEGLIKVSGYRTKNMVIIEIEDDGPGIPKPFHASIFEPFKRLSAKVDGSGLGLSLVKTTVVGWGGKIRVECPNSRGSVFVVSIPINAVVGMPSLKNSPTEIPVIH